MKTLLLMRHAKSSWENQLDDHQRPLNHRGERDAPFMAKQLKINGILPKQLLVSDAVRTRQTADAVLSVIESPEPNYRAALYHASRSTLVKELQMADRDTVMIIAHNPGVTDFVNGMSNARLDNMPTSAIACIRFDIENWSELNERTTGKLEYFLYPKMY